ncbi:hypothetical protein CK203_013695 [Vitis vinifera]|uniref:Uncharacterized protein n=1 Tax=Vitis vinifera TaxID=29760 RepID=A0A438J8Y3_VITVI|nr:hypothetical protein CK203_013695 [Vitis vinifera]
MDQIGERDFALLLEGIEHCCEERFSLIFPEERGVPGVWKTLASKLRSIGVTLEARPIKQPQGGDGYLLRESEVESPRKGVSHTGVVFRDKGEVGEAVWIQGQKEEIHMNDMLLKHCLVGRLRVPVVKVPKLAERVWRLGVCLFKGKSLHLKWWSPKASCYREWCAKDCWVRLVELPLHLWGKDFFKRLWWEILPWVLVVVPKEGCRVLEFRDDNEGKPCAKWSVGAKVGKNAKRWEQHKVPLHAAQVGAEFSMCSSASKAGGQAERMAFGPFSLSRVGEKGAPRKDNTSKDLLGVGNLSFFTNFVSFNKYLGLPMDG